MVRVHVRPIAPPNLPSLLPRDGGYLWIRRGEGMVGWGEAARIHVGTGPDRFERARDDLAAVFASLRMDDEAAGVGGEPVAFGSFTFDEAEEGSVLVIPAVQVRVRGGSACVTSIGREPPALDGAAPPDDHDFKIRYAGSTISEVEWLDRVAGVVKEIQNERVQKVVLARDIRIWSEVAFDVRVLTARLAATFPDCYTFSCDGLVGATPELLVAREAERLRSLVLAGSARRGVGQDDARIGDMLLASPKDLDEHRPAVASVETVFRRLCSEVRSSAPHLLRLANVQHIATAVEGDLREPVDALQVGGLLHPTAAVGGMPSDSAIAVIRSVEGMSRGRYAGPVGWVAPNGDGEWGIALRCAEVKGTRGRLFAGGGIVAGSEPEDELEETRLKFRAVMAALEQRP